MVFQRKGGGNPVAPVLAVAVIEGLFALAAWVEKRVQGQQFRADAAYWRDTALHAREELNVLRTECEGAKARVSQLEGAIQTTWPKMKRAVKEYRKRCEALRSQCDALRKAHEERRGWFGRVVH